MPFDTADREAHVATAQRRLSAVQARGVGYPEGHEPTIWLESLAHATANLLTAQRLLQNSLSAHA